MSKEQDFWMEKPRMMGLRGWSLLVPSIASAVGFFMFSALAFGFTELETLPEAYRRVMVLVGAFSLAFGSEVGTLSSVVEIYRKGERLGRWDALALVISIMSTVGAFILSFATLLGARASWSDTVQLYGPIILGVLSGLDSYSNFLEFGLYLNTYDKRLARWQRQYTDHVKEKALQRLEHERQLNEQKLKVRLAQIEQVAQGQQSKGGEAGTPNRAKIEETERPQTSNERLNAARLDNKEARVRAMLDFYASNPMASYNEVGEAIGVSKSTVGNYLRELERQGVVHRNGEGVEVLAGVG